jgi:hypothetical protein
MTFAFAENWDAGTQAMKRILIVALAASSLAACETGPGGPPPVYTPAAPGPEAFRDSDFAWSTGAGPGAIDGALTYKGGGGRFTCSDVVLAPETPWSRARMRILYESTTAAAMPADDVRSRTPPEHSSDYGHYARHATCDALGHFGFSGLPSGAWYVITVATPTAGGAKMAVMRRVETHGGTVTVSLH